MKTDSSLTSLFLRAPVHNHVIASHGLVNPPLYLKVMEMVQNMLSPSEPAKVGEFHSTIEGPLFGT